jgi:iron-sulfur cluster assembly protein
MFTVTESASSQIKQAAQQSGTDGMPLRLAAKQKPDGSLDYLMGFDEVKEDDIHLSTQGVEVIMAPEYVPLLDEAVMDFVELDGGDKQFIFLNPRDPNFVPPTDID